MTSARRSRQSGQEMTTWPAQRFARWLSEGAAVVADDPFGSSWALSFLPLRLDLTQVPSDQIIGELCKLADKSELAYQRAITGVGIALDHIGVVSSPRFVEFLLRVAAALDPPGYADAVLRHLRRHSVRRNHARWDRVVAQLVRNLACVGRPHELMALLEKLQSAPWFNKQYQLLYVLTAVEHDFSRWAEFKRSSSDFIETLRLEQPSDYNRLNAAANEGYRRERKPRLNPAAVSQARNAPAVFNEPDFVEDEVVVDFDISFAAISDLQSPQQMKADLAATIARLREAL